MNFILKKIVIKDFLFTAFLMLSLLFFFVDSGGVLGLRILGVVILSFYFFISILYLHKIDMHVFNISIFSFIVFIYCYLVSNYNNISTVDSINKLIVFIFMPIFIFSLMFLNHQVVKKSLIYSGLLFSLVILLTFIYFIIDPFGAEIIFKELEIPGWFYLRADNYPQVYYQATLTLVPICIFSYCYGYKKIGLVILLTLLISLSRFGFFCAIIIIILFEFFNTKKLVLSLFYIYLSIMVLFPFLGYALYVNSDLPKVYSAYSNDDGLYIRLGHLYSIYDFFTTKSFIFGSGAGSYFYTIGFHEYVDNIEISQLELLRRNGLIGYYLASSLLIYISYLLIKKELYIEFICLFAFYIISFSNPVLLTLSLSIIVACLLNQKRYSE
ncbi:Uncharacterised protein [Acinetobacter baumannii]|nr:Uncharacterised protein [Acinetobacter baumannii]